MKILEISENLTEIFAGVADLQYKLLDYGFNYDNDKLGQLIKHFKNKAIMMVTFTTLGVSIKVERSNQIEKQSTIQYMEDWVNVCTIKINNLIDMYNKDDSRGWK